MTITIGIDPHKATHTAVAIDTKEAVVGEHKVRASATQAAALIDWAQGFEARTWAVESAGGLGYLLAQQLLAAGETVVDVPPMLAAGCGSWARGARRRTTPTTPAAWPSPPCARTAWSRSAPTTTPESWACWRNAHRDMARLRNTHCRRLHALLGELHPGGIASEMTVRKANDLLTGIEAVDEVTRCRLLIAAELVEDIARLDASLKASKKRVKVAVAGVGDHGHRRVRDRPHCAAMIIGHVRDVGRFPTKGHFATYNATAPIEASSGGHSRHRLNPRGNRKVNCQPSRNSLFAEFSRHVIP